MREKEVSERRERSDKKRDIKPTIHSELYDFISDLSYVTNKPMKDIGETICVEGIRSKQVVDHISQYLRRPYQHTQTLFSGFLDRVPYKSASPILYAKKRLTMRYTSHEYENFSSLAYALDTTLSTSLELLLSTAVKDIDIINKYVLENINYTSVDENKRAVLKSIYKYISKDNPFYAPLSLAEMIKMFFELLFTSKNTPQ